MRILLVQPEYLSKGIGFRILTLPEPLHLEMVAALIPDHEVRILDLRLENDLQTALEQFAPDMVAVTALTQEVYAAQEVLRRSKAFDPNIFTVIGGHHATLLPDDFFQPETDAIALGEAELVFPQMVEAIEKGRKLDTVDNLIWQDDQGRFIRNSSAYTKIDLDNLPIARRDLTEKYRGRYFFLLDEADTSVATGRGCPFRCNFCSVWQFYQGRTSQMSPRRVLAELKTIQTKHVTFVDDNFLMNYRREHEIADLIKAEGLELRYAIQCRTDSIVRHPDLVEKWAEIGLTAVLIGLEGVSDKALKNINKSNSINTNNQAIEILHKNGLIIWGAFIVDPDWGKDDFKQLHDYVAEKEITHTQFTVLTPLPGTNLYRQRYDDLLTHDYSCFDTLHAVLPTALPREEFYRCFASLYHQDNWGPYYDLIRKEILTIDDCKRGKVILDAMSDWKQYITKDPVLGMGDKKHAISP